MATAQLDQRTLLQRFTLKSITIRDAPGFESNDENEGEKWIAIVMGVVTCVAFFCTLAYALFTKGRGRFVRMQPPYRPAEFIEMEKTTQGIASGG
ncbi:hypothetical protein DIPPA_31545 [Diplonema papillatum]|nr:hypothetical protein DIPPA_31548 [Diplonema papillatum]KAJ9455195.1 hypothetical protein DIPPA_31537 [Diplonema papillatum]KAJ9455197.1 hypothetical protein DIPPA_31545 [Diplonema papillatum]